MTTSITTGAAPFIAIDGVDGAGKGTQVQLLRDALIAKGHKVHVTCEPSDWPIGAMIRRYLRREVTDGLPGWDSMALLFAADRMQHLEHEILPRLARGETVITDRYDASSIAYQSAMRGESARVGSMASMDEALEWIAVINGHARRPDLTIILDVEPEIAAHRRSIRGGAEELLEKIDLQRRVRAQYAKIPSVRPHDRMVTIDASPAADAVHERVLAAVSEILTQPG